jgi:hypothetical protein
MVVCNAVLILTAFGLYYLGAETSSLSERRAHRSRFCTPVLMPSTLAGPAAIEGQAAAAHRSSAG